MVGSNKLSPHFFGTAEYTGTLPSAHFVEQTSFAWTGHKFSIAGFCEYLDRLPNRGCDDLLRQYAVGKELVFSCKASIVLNIPRDTLDPYTDVRPLVSVSCTPFVGSPMRGSLEDA